MNIKLEQCAQKLKMKKECNKRRVYETFFYLLKLPIVRPYVLLRKYKPIVCTFSINQCNLPCIYIWKRIQTGQARYLIKSLKGGAVVCVTLNVTGLFNMIAPVQDKNKISWQPSFRCEEMNLNQTIWHSIWKVSCGNVESSSMPSE